MYGGSAYTLFETLTDSGVDLGSKEFLAKYNCKNGKEVAQALYDAYFDSYEGVAQFIRCQKKSAKRNGFVQTVTGRKRRLHDINSNDFKVVGYQERLSVNATIQGSAADIMMNAQIRLELTGKYAKRLSELGCKMIVQVHDESIFSCPEDSVEEAMELIKYHMENPFGEDTDLGVPITVSADVGDSYQEAK